MHCPVCSPPLVRARPHPDLVASLCGGSGLLVGGGAGPGGFTVCDTSGGHAEELLVVPDPVLSEVLRWRDFSMVYRPSMVRVFVSTYSVCAQGKASSSGSRWIVTTPGESVVSLVAYCTRLLYWRTFGDPDYYGPFIFSRPLILCCK